MGDCACVEQRVYGKSLCLLNFAVEHKTALKCKV